MIKRILIVLLLGVGGAGIVRSFFLEGVWVASGSMEPTLPVGTHYFENRMVYRLQTPKRGEIIVFKSPVNAEKGLIKRVIATPGDTIEIQSKRVLLNGAILSEPYAVYKRAGERLVGDNMPAIKVPPQSYFVLGDNRDESEDSSGWRNPRNGDRIYFINAKDIEGRLMIP